MKTQRHIVAGLVLGLVLLAGAQTAGAQVRDLFNNTNTDAVRNGPIAAPRFTLTVPTTITQVVTYHWNDRRGATPGFISISRRNGQVVGRFQARGTAGQGGVANVNWIATPNLVLPAGQYNVLDSSVSTWSTNARSGFVGFGIVRGFAVTTPGTGNPPPAGDGSCATGRLLSPIPSVSFQSVSDVIGGSDTLDCFVLNVGLANGSPFYPPRSVTVTLSGSAGASLALVAAQAIRTYYGTTVYFPGQVIATVGPGQTTKVISRYLFEGSYCVQVIGAATPTAYSLAITTP